MGIGVFVLDIGGNTGVGTAGTTGDTWLLGIRVGGVAGIEPEHVRGVIVPDRQHEHHADGHRLANTRQSSMVTKRVLVAERYLSAAAEIGIDRVLGIHSRNVDLGVLDDLAALDV